MTSTVISGPSAYRAFAFESKPARCENCGYRKRPDVLEVHHVDGNRLDNRISNLQILCPTCHAIVEADKRKFERKARYIQWLVATS